MSIRNLFGRSVRRSFSTQTDRRRKRLRKRLMLQESLEDRRLLATVEVVGNVLTFNNSGIEQNDLSLSLDASGNLVLRDSANEVNAGAGVTDLDADPQSLVIPAADLAAIDTLEVNTHGGDDTLTIDNSNGLIEKTIAYAGGDAGFDTLRLLGSTPTTTTYNMGQTYDAGTVIQENDGVAQRVEFSGLEPIQVLAPAAGNNILNFASAPLGIGFPQALQGDNAINYTEGPNSNDPGDIVFAGAITGLLTVDGFESLEFANFEVLNIDAGAGSDEINLNHASADPANELGEINVVGGDPTASDQLIVNAVPGVADILTLAPTDQGAGQITSSLAAIPPINYTTFEHIDVVVQATDLDGGGLDGTIGSDNITLRPLNSATEFAFSGLLDFSNVTGNGPFTLPEVSFHNVNRFTGIEVNQNVVGGFDVVNYHGTSNDDQAIIDGELITLIVDGDFVLNAGSGVNTSTEAIHFHGGEGGDSINVTPSDQTAVTVYGGQPDSGSDTLNFLGTGGAVTNSLSAHTIVEAGMLLVRYEGVESVNIAADADLTINGGADDNDVFSVTPLTADNNGTFEHNNSPGVEFNYFAATSITFNGALGENQLNILGDVDDDAITSTPNSVVVDGSEVTLGGGFASIQVLGLEGDDEIDLSDLGAGLAAAYTVRGGDGDDSITGTLQEDTIFGDAGNDNLIGGAGVDFIYGGLGNDTIGGATLGSDDPGNDYFFGGDGSDTFIWEPGDGQDFIGGGDDGDDVFEFRGRGLAGDLFILSADDGHVDAMFNAAIIDVAGVENIEVTPLDGASANVTVNDLFATETVQVEINLPAGGTPDSVVVEGRNVADDIDVSVVVEPIVRLEGLRYDVQVNGSAANEDRLTVFGNNGDDSIKAQPLVETVIDITFHGDAGDDVLSADAVLFGGVGNDILIGGAGNDSAFGEDGDDTFVLRTTNQGGTDSFDGGAGFDTVLVEGTVGPDAILVDEAAGDHVISINGGGPTSVGAGSEFERLLVDTGEGDDTVTTSGNVVGLEVQLGAGDDVLDAELQLTPVLAFGGQGNDNLIGSDPADGAAASDILFGGDGDDRIEGGRGQDQFFGGDGNDYFIWVAGDGSDLMEGGDGDADALEFVANGGANRLEVFGGGIFGANGNPAPNVFVPGTLENEARVIFALNSTGQDTAQVFLNLGDLETIDILAEGGADAVSINNQVSTTAFTPGGDSLQVGTDLAITSLRGVAVDLGADADGDFIEVHGKLIEDNIDATLRLGDVDVAGLGFGVRIGSQTVDDRIIIHGQSGDDDIKVHGPVETTIGVTVNGNEGDDILSADAIINGGAGDDFIQGGAGNDLLFGGPGEDTFIGGSGDDNIDGDGTLQADMVTVVTTTDDFDTIQIDGTTGDDIIDVNQTAAGTLVHTVNGVTETDSILPGTIERAHVLAGAGADLVRVNWLDGLNDAVVDSLRMTVEGGDDATSDRLVVVDDGTDDLVLHRVGQNNGSGTVQVGPGNAEPLLSIYSGVERLDFVDEAGVAINNFGGGAPVAPASGPQLVVFKFDPFESNDDRFNATFLGAGDTLNVDPTIDPGPLADPFGDGQNLGGDADWYRLVAEETGTLDLQVYFRQVAALDSGRPGLPNDGNLDITVYDANGNAISGFGANDADDDERVRIPAVAGQTYFLRVNGNADAINVYNISVVNAEAPTPFDLELADNLTILTGDQEVPAVATTASGTANFQYDAAANTFDVDLFVSGLEVVDNTALPQVTVAHLHLGAAGVNGVVIVDLLSFGPTFVQEPGGIRLELTGAAFPAANVADLLAGNVYFNVHSSANLTGEVRGQINIPNVAGVSDSGRSQFDNVTQDTTPTIFLRLDDAWFLNDVPGNAAGTVGTPPVDELIPIPHVTSTASSPVDLPAGFRVAIYDETDTHNPVLLGFAQPVTNLNGVYQFTFEDVLTDGSHFISARVQMIDPADNDAAVVTSTPATGFGPRSASLEIIVDAVPPPITFGLANVPDDGLHADSDSGDPFVPETLSDNATNDTTPTFWGIAEANTLVNAYLDLDNSGSITDADIFLGQTTANPQDGTNQEPNGYWEITSAVNMNHPDVVAALGFDGLRTILISGEDLAGNESPNDQAVTLDIFIDTQGPQVTDVRITDFLAYDLFQIKPDNVNQGPTPRVDGLTIAIEDLPERVAGFLLEALSNVDDNDSPIRVIGDHTGIAPLDSIIWDSDPVVAGAAATGNLLLTFLEPLRDDRYTLVVDDSLIDPVGNQLDGESDSERPLGGLTLPSGDKIPGGDFVARFTVDSRPEVGSYSQSLVYVDINGNGVWDPEGQDNDFTNRDFTFQFGRISDGLFAGNFHEAGVNGSGFDKLGAYGFFNGSYSFLIDTNDDGVGDVASLMPPQYQVNGIPVAGNFDGNLANGDEIGLFDGVNWYLDFDGSNSIDLGEAIPADYNGIPMVGEFDGDGDHYDLAVWDNEFNTVSFDVDADGIIDDIWDVSDDFGRLVGLSGFVDRPVVGDLNLDGVDDIGIWIKGRQGQLPKESGEYFFWLSDDTTNVPSDNFNPFSYDGLPGGNDLFVQFGDETALPIFGNFDPVIASTTSSDLSSLTNDNPYDVNNDGSVSALDALLVINALNRGVSELDLGSDTRLKATFGDGSYYDVDGSGVVSAQDALRIINQLNRTASSEPEGEQVAWAGAVDHVFEDDDEDLLDETIGLIF